MTKKQLEKEKEEFLASVIYEVHDLFDKEDVWKAVGEIRKPTRKVLVIFFKAVELINERYFTWAQRFKDDKGYGHYMDTSRIFYDALFGYLIGEREGIGHYSRGGLLISIVASLATITELSDQLEMYTIDDEIPHLNYRNKFLKRLLK